MKTKEALHNVELICCIAEKLKEDLEYRKSKNEFLDEYNGTSPYIRDRLQTFERMKGVFKSPPITDKEVKRSLMMIRKLALNTYKNK